MLAAVTYPNGWAAAAFFVSPLFAAMPDTTESATEERSTEERQLPMGESLDARLRTVRRQFYREFDDIENGIEYFCQFVWEDVLVVKRMIRTEGVWREAGLWLVSYQWNGGDVMFSPPEDWSEVEPAFVEVEEVRVLLDIEEEKFERWADGEDTIQVDRVHAVSGPFIRMATDDPMAVQCRKDQRPYYRDFGPWDGPSPTVTRAETEDRVTVTINSTHEDRHGTIILPRGGRIDGYNESNPIVLINHDHDRPAGTSTVSVVGRDGRSSRLQADMQDDAWDHDDEEVMRWFRKVTRENPIVRSASIGALFHEVVPGREYDGIEDLLGREVNNRDRLPHIVTDWTLVEWSWVSVPSNPAATMALAEAERIARAAESRFISGLRSLEHELHTTKSQVSVPDSAETSESDAPSREGKPSQEDRSVSSETGPSGEPERADNSAGQEGDGASTRPTPRRLSDREAKSLIMEGFHDELDRITGRK